MKSTIVNALNRTTICAPITAVGKGAVAMIRLSGDKSIQILDSVFHPFGKQFISSLSDHVVRYGKIERPINSSLDNFSKSEIVDDVLVVIFKAPHSYTGEDCVEISCHASDYIVQEILDLLLTNGAVLAAPGEFTRRAFLNGKMDLAQAEAVADLISSETAAAHRIAIQQMRGGFSNELKEMRSNLVNLASLMELELDFSEEDVKFADRSKLETLLNTVSSHIEKLICSFRLGNVIKNGVPVAIIGVTNTGKSTLLNALIGEERAIVSNIHGTTRDFIEEIINIEGIIFRLIDTAGIREADGVVEKLGIERSLQKMENSSIILLVLDAERPDTFQNAIKSLKFKPATQDLIILLNKADRLSNDSISSMNPFISTMISTIKYHCDMAKIHPYSILPISAKFKEGLNQVRLDIAETQKGLNFAQNGTLISNTRHFEALQNAQEAISRVKTGLQNNISTELIVEDINQALYHIGSITGEVTNDEILQNIFKNFCIGK